MLTWFSGVLSKLQPGPHPESIFERVSKRCPCGDIYLRASVLLDVATVASKAYRDAVRAAYPSSGTAQSLAIGKACHRAIGKACHRGTSPTYRYQRAYGKGAQIEETPHGGWWLRPGVTFCVLGANRRPEVRGAAQKATTSKKESRQKNGQPAAFPFVPVVLFVCSRFCAFLLSHKPLGILHEV
jgi:hypothetical protein